MVSEIVRPQDGNPIIQPQHTNSTARGSENIASVLGKIADRSIAQATDFASEASKANLLQTHGMLQDIESQSKIDILKSPGHAEAITKNASDTISKIKSSARLNRGDRLNLDSMADNTARSLNLIAAEKTISLGREQAKYNALTTFGNTLQSIRQDIFNNPEQAESLIAAQYESLKGQVQSGIITAVEGANLHKQFSKEMEMAQELVTAMKSGIISASDLSTMHATQPGQLQTSNANLPMDHGTSMNADHYFGHLTLHDIQARLADGVRVSPRDLVSIKKTSDLDKILNYGAGAARATGDINSGTSWVQLKHNLEDLKKKQKLSSRDEGYKNRLNNFFINAEKSGAYQNFIYGTPEGGRIYNDFVQNQTVIDKDVPFGSESQVALQKHIRSVDNLNNLISRSDALGIGMHYPDYLRQPIPQQYLSPIVNAFNKDGNINAAISNITMLSPKNRAYAMNAFPGDYRKQLTVLEVGNLAEKADPGFLVKLFRSQQVGLSTDEGKKTATQEKFLQLSRDKEGYSDQKLIGKILPSITSISTYLSKQPNGGALVSSKIDQAVRFIKNEAVEHNDPNFKQIDDYIKDFATNMEKAYQVSTGFNFVMDSNTVPLEDHQKQILASHGINEVRQKLLEYKTEAQVESMFSVAPPIMVSSPGGRITVVDPNGNSIPDKYGHPAYDEIYTEGVWRSAEQDMETTNKNQFLQNQSVLQYFRSKPEILRPEVEGNITLENRPKVWDKKGNFQTVKTITREFDNKTVLLPKIINGKEVSVKEATDHYLKTGEHLGIFKNKEDADKYDKDLHIRMGWLGEANKWGGK